MNETRMDDNGIRICRIWLSTAIVVKPVLLRATVILKSNLKYAHAKQRRRHIKYKVLYCLTPSCSWVRATFFLTQDCLRRRLIPTGCSSDQSGSAGV